MTCRSSTLLALLLAHVVPSCCLPLYLLSGAFAPHLNTKNVRYSRGWTPLHRAAHLAHLDGYLELYEYLLVG